jgi:hypothetical protein
MKLNQKKFLTSLQLKLHQLPTKTPEFTVTFNGNVQTAQEVIDSVATFVMYSDFGENQLVIQFLNKDLNDTMVDQDGNIIGDLAVEIKSMTISDVDITHQVKKKSCYIFDNNTAQHTHYGYMHRNGHLTFDFQCPIFYFLRNCNLLVDHV